MKTSIGLLLASMALAPIAANAAYPLPTGKAQENVTFCYTEKAFLEANQSLQSGDYAKLIEHNQSGICAGFNGEVHYTVIPVNLVSKKSGVYVLKVKPKNSEFESIVYTTMMAMEWSK